MNTKVRNINKVLLGILRELDTDITVGGKLSCEFQGVNEVTEVEELDCDKNGLALSCVYNGKYIYFDVYRGWADFKIRNLSGDVLIDLNERGITESFLEDF